MNKYQKFYFEKFEFDKNTLTADFFYSFDKKLFFKETINFSDSNFKLREDLDLNIIENILFHLHIALGISYYKFYIPNKLVLETGILEKNQIKFWEKFYLNGLGEFFYRNNIDPNGLINFEFESSPPTPLLEERGEILTESQNLYQNFNKKVDFKTSEKYLVPVGGGKDSIVSIELLKKLNKKIDLVTFAVNDNILYENTSEISGCKRLFIKRKLSENIMEVVNSGAYNGHVPITGIIAFVLEVASYIYDYKYIVLSNEKSANDGNIFWKGVDINHQWSKSYEFEHDFNEYVKFSITDNVEYFSLLRPFYELKIAELFSKFGKKYFKKFSSCNVNFKIFNKKTFEKGSQYWCNSCPKCAFVYSILRPFLSKEETLQIFSRELYEDKSLEILFRELLGISGIKPFECVGTNEEVTLAMKISLDNWEGNLPYILQIFKNEVDVNMEDRDYENLKEKVLNGDFENNLIPKELLEKLIKIP